MDGKKKLQSLIKQVQSTTTAKLGLSKDRSSNSIAVASDTRLDLNSAIEYNRYLINSYLEERNSRELPLYDKIISESKDQNEDQIIESIEKEFFLQQLSNSCDNDDNDDVVSINLNTDVKQLTNCDNNNDLSVVNGDIEAYSQSKILEICVLEKLPEFNPTAPNLFLNFIELEKKKLTKQVTIVSKRLSDMIVANKTQLSEELNRVNLIDSDVQTAIQTCSSGRNSLSYTKRDFTSKSLTIVENYQQRESIIKIIKYLLNIKTIQTTIEHIQNLLEYEKNFPSAIRLYYETCHILEEMAPKFSCVEEMRVKLAAMLEMAEEQMDSVLSKLPDRFCRQTYQQLCEAYQQIGKSETLIHQLLMHFNNTIYEKAFSIVHGYVKLFSDLSLSSSSAHSTPIKSSMMKNSGSGPSDQDLKRKPFAELCQYLKPESFLSCLTDLCRAMWDIMQNYYQIVLFYRSNSGYSKNVDQKFSKGYDEDDDAIRFANTKLKQGVLRVWSDIQHKIRTIISSVKFVDSSVADSLLNNNLSLPNDVMSKSNETIMMDDLGGTSIHRETSTIHHQDQLLFSFDEFIKILTVCEKMIEIGEEFCGLYDDDKKGNGFDSTLQNTLYQQTRAYFQSYHQVSMAELRIFLENETWTRCPIDSQDEFQLIANLQEFSFIKHRLSKLSNRTKNRDEKEEEGGSTSTSTIKNNARQLTKSSNSSSSYLLSPTIKTRHYFFNNKLNSEIDEADEESDDDNRNDGNLNIPALSPFDDIFVLLTDTKVRYDSDPSDSDDAPTQHHSQLDNNDDDFEIVRDDNVTGGGNCRETEIVTTNTALNVVRLIGRYMHIMYLLRPISHDIIRALLELFDYYFFTVYRFFAIDPLNAVWLTPFLASLLHHQSGSIVSAELNVSISSQSHPPSSTPTPTSQSSSNTPLINHLSTELRYFIRRINETLIINESSSSSTSSNLNSSSISSSGIGLATTPSATSPLIPHNNTNQSFNKSSSDSALMLQQSAASTSPSSSSPKRIIKHPCPMLPSYVAINSPNNLFALGERIMAIQSLIFIARQFYNLCPFLLDFLRKEEESLNESFTTSTGPAHTASNKDCASVNKKSTEDGFKMLQFYHDQMCLNVESLLYQCLLAVSTKLLPYDSIISSMCQIKWDLKEIPSIHSNYVDVFVESIRRFNEQYLSLLKTCDLEFLIPEVNVSKNADSSFTEYNNSQNTLTETEETDDLVPLSMLDQLSRRTNQLLWECIVRVSNRSFVEGFSSAKKCTNEGRALMQLDYQQFLSHIEKIMSPYFFRSVSSGGGGGSVGVSNLSGSSRTTDGVRAAKALLTNEKEFVEEFVKAFYLTDAIFIDWIRQRPDYTTKQIVSLIHCLTHDNRKQRSFLLAAVDTSSIELSTNTASSSN